MAAGQHTVPSRPAAHRAVIRQLIRPSLIAVTGFSALSAIGGGIGVIANGLGIPASELADTPFDSFFVPGLLLSAVVGGSMATATISLLRRVPWAGEAAVAAGTIMLGWIAVEAMMIQDGRPLQLAVAVVSLATILLGWAHTREGQGAAHTVS